MANLSAIIAHVLQGPITDLNAALAAITAIETPQIFLRWQNFPIDVDTFRILRREKHNPTSETDGKVVFERFNRPEVTYFADTTVSPGKVYYYTVWCLIDGVWVRPTYGHSDWAFSGSDVHLED